MPYGIPMFQSKSKSEKKLIEDSYLILWPKGGNSLVSRHSQETAIPP